MSENYYCNRVVVQAPGKVNLSLDITGCREDGYHLLDMVMQTVDLSDILIIERKNSDTIDIVSSFPNMPQGEQNICHHAAQHFFKATGLPAQGLDIQISKHIPMQAGMAGGSADAAAVLRGLDRLFETALTDEQLCEIGLLSGADVPFCLTGGCAFVQGIGEKILSLPALPNCWMVIAKPPVGMSTGMAFNLYDTMGVTHRPDTTSMLAAVKSGNLAAIGTNLRNVFEQITNIPEVETLKGIMLCDGALGAVMTGSGTAVVGLFDEEADAKTALRHLREQVAETYLTRPTESGARVVLVG